MHHKAIRRALALGRADDPQALSGTCRAPAHALAGDTRLAAPAVGKLPGLS